MGGFCHRSMRSGLKLTIELSKLHGSLHSGKQHVNARKAPVGVWQLRTSATADGGVIGFRLVDEDKVFDCQIDGADRDPQRNGG